MKLGSAERDPVQEPLRQGSFAILKARRYLCYAHVAVSK